MIVRRISNDELYHHGVKGQEWGVRNGPPYPLDAKGRALRKQQRLNKRLQNEQSQTDKGRDKLLKSKRLSDRDRDLINHIADKRKNVQNDYYTNKMKATTDKTIKKTDEYKNSMKSMGNQNQRKTVYAIGLAGPGSVYPVRMSEKTGIKWDMAQIKANDKKMNKVVKKYANSVLNNYDPKKAEKARRKVDKVMNQVNKDGMKLADIRVSSYGFDSSGNVHVDYEHVKRK